MLVLAACTPPATLDASPQMIAFGDVYITGNERPEDGWAGIAEVKVRNDGDATVAARIEAYDHQALLLQGFDDLPAPLDLGDLAPGSEYLLRVGIAGYADGESDSVQEKTIEVGAELLDSPLVITVHYTPHRRN